MLPLARRAILVDWLIPLLIVLPLAWALLPGGVVNTADGKVHFYRAAEMIHAWQDGVLIPRWSQHLGFGYGIPLFVYTPPLPSFLTAGLYQLGFAPEAAFKGMWLIAMLLAGYGAYHLGRGLLGRWAGAVTAAAFLYTPFFLRELFIQGNAAQYLAWSFTPWAAAAVIRLYHAPRGRDAVYLALALMGVQLSHHVVALFAAGMAAGLGLVLFAVTRDRRGLGWTVAGGCLGLALSLWFWGPALLEGRYVALNRIVASDFHARFITLAELVAWPPRLDSAAINPYVPLTLGAAQIAAALMGLGGWWVLLRRTPPGAALPVVPTRILGGVGLFMALLAAVGGWMATRWSAPVWDVLPFTDLFEFPARWHGAPALGLSWLSGAAVPGTAALAAPGRRAKLAIAVGTALLLAILAAALAYLYPQKLPPGTRSINPADVVRYEVKSMAVGTTSLGEFDPIWVEGVLRSSPLVGDYLAGRPINRLPDPLPPGVQGEMLECSVQRHQYRLRVAAPTSLTFNLLYFPGWQAAVDGRPTPVRPHPATGLVDVDLPAGESILTLTFAETPLRRTLDWVSAVTWAGLVILSLIWIAQRHTQPPRPPLQPHVEVAPLLGVAAVVGLALVARGLLPDWWQVHSPPDRALPAQELRRADFGGQLRLLGIDPAPPVVAPGETLMVVAYWRTLQKLDADYAVFLHLDDPVAGETLATVDQTHPSDIPTSAWATGQYVRNPLRLAVPADAPPIQYALRVGFYDAGTGARLPATGAAPEGEIGRVWVEPRRPPRPPAGPQARFGDSLELLGARPDPSSGTVTFYWRAAAPLQAGTTIFVHLLDGAGQLIAQVDGAPYANRYPLDAWRAGQIVEDRRALAPGGVPLDTLQRIAVGVYRLESGERLPAVDDQGSRLAGDALMLAWP